MEQVAMAPVIVTNQTTQIDWSAYNQIKSFYDFKSIKLLSDSLKSLLSSSCLKINRKIFESVSKRIVIRLRTAKVCRLLKHINKCLDNLFKLRITEVMVENLSSLVNENYDISSGSIVLPFRQQIESVLNVFMKSAPILRKIILVSMNAFSCSYQWLRCGNLAPHFLLMSSCLSRINFISKAIMVYIIDLYSPLIAIKDILKDKQTIYNADVLYPESLQHFLIDLNIKCDTKLTETVTQFSNSNEDIAEDIGVPIQRNEWQTKKKPKSGNNSKTKKKMTNKSNFKSKQIIKTKLQKQIQKKRKNKRKN